MKQVRVYAVITRDRVRLETLDQDEALTTATRIFNEERADLGARAQAPDVRYVDRVPIDHTQEARGR